jgi:hypothetical protein
VGVKVWVQVGLEVGVQLGVAVCVMVGVTLGVKVGVSVRVTQVWYSTAPQSMGASSKGLTVALKAANWWSRTGAVPLDTSRDISNPERVPAAGGATPRLAQGIFTSMA